MQTTLSSEPETMTPTEAERLLARESGVKLAQFLKSRTTDLPFRLQDENRDCEPITIPRSALRLLTGILTEMGQGHAVTLQSLPPELGTNQAADLLNVSLNFFEKMLDAGAISYRLVGGRRRIRLDDLMNYKKKVDEAGRKALEELVALGQELDMGY